MPHPKLILLYWDITIGKVIKCCFILVLGGGLICKLDDFTCIYIILFQYIDAPLCKNFDHVYIMFHVICDVYYFRCYKLVTFSASVVRYSRYDGYLLVSPVKPLAFILMLVQVVLYKVVNKDHIPKKFFFGLLVLHIIPRCHECMLRHCGHVLH